MRIDEILAAGPVMPVVVIDDAAHAVPLARALVAGGNRAIEITLRTGAALDAVQAIAREVPDAIPGVGTALTGADVLAALGGPFPNARFCPTGGVSPANAASYLALPNVLCVGGSWIAPREAIAAADFGR